VAVDFRFAYNDNARLRELASELVRRRVAQLTMSALPPKADIRGWPGMSVKRY
jgi:hypothetical protein